MTAQLIAAALALLSALVVAIGTVIRHLVAAEQPLPEEGLGLFGGNKVADNGANSNH